MPKDRLIATSGLEQGRFEGEIRTLGNPKGDLDEAKRRLKTAVEWLVKKRPEFTYSLHVIFPSRTYLVDETIVPAACATKWATVAFNSEFVLSLRSTGEVAFLVLHELYHFLTSTHLRGARIPDLDSRTFNIAADLAINWDIRKHYGDVVVAPEDAIFPDNVTSVFPHLNPNDFPPNKTTEYYYNKLLNSTEQQAQNTKPVDPSPDRPAPNEPPASNMGSTDPSAAEQPAPSMEPADSSTESNRKPTGPLSNPSAKVLSCIEGADKLPEEEISQEVIEEIINTTAIEASDMADLRCSLENQSRGFTPGSMIEKAPEHRNFATRPPWPNLLAGVVGDACVATRRSGGARPDWRREPRRQSGDKKLIVPAHRSRQIRVDYIIDSSGSMSRGLLKTALACVAGRTSALSRSKSRVSPRTRIFWADAKLYDKPICTTHSGIVRSAHTMDIYGHGGTSMGIAVREYYKKVKDPADLTVLITDGITDSDWPNPGDIPKGKKLFTIVLGPGASDRLPPSYIPSFAIEQMVEEEIEI